MDSEFINLYVKKQQALIGELQSKLVLCETQLELTTQKYNILLEAEKNKKVSKGVKDASNSIE
jgi:hypothetical protein